MSHKKSRMKSAASLFLLFCGLCAAAVQPNVASAQEGVKITITTPEAWLRSAPSLTAGNSVPVAKGQFYDVTARTADNAWLQLAVPDAAGKGTWLYAGLGALYAGDLKAAPVVSPPGSPSSKPAKKAAAFPAWIPAITPQQRAVYRGAVKAGKDPSVFTVVGDCNSQPAVYLQRLASGQFDASTLDARLQGVVQQFAPSFSRISLAAEGGLGAGMMMDPMWADGALCDKNAGPFACELWVSRASVVFISLGTQEQYSWKDFEKNYRPMIEHALGKGVLPVLVTKADDIETASGAPSGSINDVIRKLAKEYSVPLLDFHAAAQELPNGGLIDEGDKDFHQSYAGMDRRILTTLQTLAAITGR
jgi:hypothetical protein